MSIQDLGALGELVAAIATIVTLLYLALQIRRNTKAQIAATEFSSDERNQQYMLAFMQDPAIAELVLRGNAGERLSSIDWMRYRE